MYTLDGPLPPVAPESASPAAQMWWVCTVAQHLSLVDEELLHGWAAGEFTDHDVLDNIARHGAFPETRRDPVTYIRRAADLLHDRVNNLLCGLLGNASGNFGC
jgi:hypothetical protein